MGTLRTMPAPNDHNTHRGKRGHQPLQILVQLRLASPGHQRWHCGVDITTRGCLRRSRDKRTSLLELGCQLKLDSAV